MGCEDGVELGGRELMGREWVMKWKVEKKWGWAIGGEIKRK